MLLLFVVVLMVLDINAQTIDPNHNVKYVFEIVRHGARAP